MNNNTRSRFHMLGGKRSSKPHRNKHIKDKQPGTSKVGGVKWK